MHRLLERQLKLYRGDSDSVPGEWRDFVAAVDAAYREADDDRALREHTMETMLGELTERNRQLQREKTEQALLIERLEQARQQLVQSEKLASIGQLAAGVAHEINNPIGFVHSNMASLTRYFGHLLRVLEHFETHRAFVEGAGEAGRAWVAEVEALKAEVDYPYLKEDIPVLLAESADGIERVKQIVADLKDFSRIDSGDRWEMADLLAGIDSTLNIARNEVKYTADIVKEYGALPPVECLPAQLNQVFMNLIVNAAQAMPEGRRGTIAIRTGQSGDSVRIEITDNGSGMSEATLKHIFDPFFTTKPVGQGTGLGLSLAHGIVEKHGGRIEVDSTLGVGTTFRIVLPIRQPDRTACP